MRGVMTWPTCLPSESRSARSLGGTAGRQSFARRSRRVDAISDAIAADHRKEEREQREEAKAGQLKELVSWGAKGDARLKAGFCPAAAESL